MKSKPLIIGHRGAMGYETENTLASVQKALNLGVDMIEIDVFKIRSGEIVVFHDTHVERLSNGKGPIEGYDLKSLEELKLKGGHHIPTLQEVLKQINNKIALNIELKGANTAKAVNIIMDAHIKQMGWDAGHFIISSFNWDELKSMRQVNAMVKIAVLTEEDPLGAIPIAKELDAAAINPNFKTLTQENTQAIHDEGFKVYTWTVNEPEDIEQMKQYDVDGIITNYPDRVN